MQYRVSSFCSTSGGTISLLDKGMEKRSHQIAAYSRSTYSTNQAHCTGMQHLIADAYTFTRGTDDRTNKADYHQWWCSNDVKTVEKTL